MPFHTQIFQSVVSNLSADDRAKMTAWFNPSEDSGTLSIQDTAKSYAARTGMSYKGAVCVVVGHRASWEAWHALGGI